MEYLLSDSGTPSYWYWFYGLFCLNWYIKNWLRHFSAIRTCQLHFHVTKIAQNAFDWNNLILRSICHGVASELYLSLIKVGMRKVVLIYIPKVVIYDASSSEHHHDSSYIRYFLSNYLTIKKNLGCNRKLKPAFGLWLLNGPNFLGRSLYLHYDRIS